jgi:hypothetical protein
VPAGPLGRTRLLEALAFISTEVHKAYKPFYVPSASDANRAKAGATIARRLEFLTANLRGPYLLGSRFTVARKFGVTVPAALTPYFERVMARDAVQRAIAEEGLSESRKVPGRAGAGLTAGGQGAAFSSTGRVKINVAPHGSFFSAHSRPP